MIYIAFIWGCNKIIPQIIHVSTDLENLEKVIAKKANRETLKDFASLLNVDISTGSGEEFFSNESESFGPRIVYQGKGKVYDYKLKSNIWMNLYKLTKFPCSESCHFGMSIFCEELPDLELMRDAISKASLLN